MKRQSWKIFTDVSFYIAITAIAGLIISIVTPLRVLFIVLILTMLGIPLSILSMFSREHIAKRIAALAGNLMPISLFIFAVTMDFIEEFFRTAP
ncbi:MAG: 2-acyl-glycerophospho-ethanolamine acyltransferase [Bacillota bacterium]